MRGPLREQIQNAINRALRESLGHTGDSQAAYINVGGRRRNRKKKKNNKKNNGVSGSAWSSLVLVRNEPPVRSRVDIPPKAKGSPTVTKAKKTCKEIKARLSPPRCRKDGDQDDKPLINDAAEDENDENQVDQENIDPSKMPLSSLFKTTKAKKNKKGKDKDGTDNVSVTSDDVTRSTAASELQHQTSVEQSTDDVTVMPSADDVIVPSPDDVTKTAENEVTDKVPFEDDTKEGKATDFTGEEANSSDGKTDLAVGKDTPAVLYTTENRDATIKKGEGPQLTLSAADGVAVEGQPIKADGALPPETGREKESLLRDHNPEGMICCTIL